ncbi:MAG: response regulator transcription factor [Flavobacteriales bacterium]|nr:response regulator transcription factor [Flavobacteriales bacterium]
MRVSSSQFIPHNTKLIDSIVHLYSNSEVTVDILIAEDEPKLASFIKQGLEEEGFDVQVCFDGDMAARVLRGKSFDLAIFDLILPLKNGLELCKLAKEKHPNMPVIMLTALGTMDDKLAGFDAGADDYMVKPFEFLELLARIRALLKRSNLPLKQANVLKYSDLELDLNMKRITRGGETHELTAKEFALLEFLMRNKEKVHDRLTIVDQVWDLGFDTGTNIVDVYITLLRKKVDKNHDEKLIHTRVGLGYYFGIQ